MKFQKRTLEACYTPDELDTPRDSPWGTTTREQKIGIELQISEYQEIDRYCRGRLPWFASPWDTKSIFLINQLGSEFIKVPSALLTNDGYLKIVARTAHLPVILSTGMSDYRMIDHAIEVLGKDRIYAILHCTSTYPSVPEEQNLKCITEMKYRYPWAKIGFSNHFPGIPFMAAAVGLGAEMIEFHVTLDRTMYGSDQASSLEPHAVFKLVKYIRGIERAMGDGEKVIYPSELPIIEKLRK